MSEELDKKSILEMSIHNYEILTKGACDGMAERKDVVCDECSATIELEGLIEDRVIGRDEDGDIKEKFFKCPVCGHHYTVTVYNRRMLLKMQKRRQLQVKIRRAWGRASSAQQFKSWAAEDQRLKVELIKEAHVLRRKYLKGE